MDEHMRAMVHGKSNLAPPGVSQAFGLDPANGFCWLGEYDISIDDLMSGRRSTPENQFSRAQRLIESALAGEPIAAVEIMQMAEEQGISAKTLNRAKSALGVQSVKRCGKWFWELPIEVPFTECPSEEDGQDGHVSPATALTILPNQEAG